MSQTKRLYIITGKGGVGKTTVALALAKRLNRKGVKARYLNFTTSSLTAPVSDIQEIQLAQKMGVPYTALTLGEAAAEYTGRKIKSKTAGKWVVKTPFFKALVSMIPGFNYLIYLGKALDMLNNDKELVFVLDSPSSGHALTMLEATKNFGDIFQSGLLFEDTQKMINLLYSENFAQINILSLPTLLAAGEALELEEDIKRLAPVETKIFCNNSFKELEGSESIELPEFLRLKLDTEKEIERRMKGRVAGLIKHSLSNDEADIVDELAAEADRLV